MDTFEITLRVTEEQRETIEALFNHNTWDFDVVHDSRNVQEQRENAPAEPIIAPVADADKCEHCLCMPCVTNEQNKQQWWIEEPSLPCARNSAQRKEKYKKFWVMLHHRGIWITPEYTARKQEAMNRVEGLRGLVTHRRDIMPNCVIKLVRFWLPNIPGEPYMGHMWE